MKCYGRDFQIDGVYDVYSLYFQGQGFILNEPFAIVSQENIKIRTCIISGMRINTIFAEIIFPKRTNVRHSRLYLRIVSKRA